MDKKVKHEARHESNSRGGEAATVPPPLAPDERRAKGKALRASVPREMHGGWKAPANRRDPVEILAESNEGRLLDLVPIRFGRMMQSPFTFYRGSASIMAADLATTAQSGLRVQACGDAHLLNFGGFATPERHVVFDINDLDETLPAPWEWDVKRGLDLDTWRMTLDDAARRVPRAPDRRSVRQRRSARRSANFQRKIELGDETTSPIGMR